MWLASPAFRRTCRACESYQYAPDGTIDRDPASGDPLERPKGAPTPCLSCPKVPRWAKAAGRDWDECRLVADELSDANRAALAAYYRRKATGRFPADPISDWAAGVIREAEDELVIEQAARQSEVLIAALTALGKR